MTNSRATRVALFALLTSACASSRPPPRFESFVLDQTPTRDAHPGAPAVVLLDRATITFYADRAERAARAYVRRYHRLKILTEAGLEAAEVVLPYDPGSALWGLSARVTAPDGQVRELPRSGVADIEHESGTRARSFVAEGAMVGSVIEYTYDLEVDDPRFLPPWSFRHELPTERSELAVIVPPGFEVDHRLTESGAPLDRPPERFEVPEGTRLSWTFLAQPPIPGEPDRAALAMIAPTAHIIFMRAEMPGYDDPEGFSSWNAFARWFLAEHPTWARLSAEQQAEARRLAGDAPVEERALKLHTIVARDLAWDPGPRVPLWRAVAPAAENVLDMKHGNQTSRGLLLTALLRAAGIEARPALFAYRDRGLLFPDLPTVHAIDGVVAVVQGPRGPFVLDPSSLTASTDVPNPRLQGARIVMMGDDGSTELMRVPVTGPEASSTEVELKLEVDREGRLRGKAEVRLLGAEAGALRAVLLAAEPTRYPELVSRFLARRGAGLSLEAVTVADVRELRRPLTLTGEISATSIWRRAEDETATFELGALVGGPSGAARERRTTALVLEGPRVARVRARLLLPEDHDLAEVPPVFRAEWPGGNATLEARGESRRRLVITREFVETQLAVEPAKYPTYRAFLEALQRAARAEVTARRPPLRTPSY